MDKATIKRRIEQIQERVVDDLEKAFTRDIVSADIDETETKDPEDFSHQRELNEMARTMELRLNKSKDDLKYLRRLPLTEQTTVDEGAFVVTDKYAFYVAIAIHPFDVNGMQIVGISTESPIYRAMHDKTAGDSFTFSGKNYEILSVQ